MNKKLQILTISAEGFCFKPVEAAGWLPSSIKLTQDHNMLVILICIHWLERGRHELSSDLFSDGSHIHIQCTVYSTIQWWNFCHSFHIQHASRAKNSHYTVQNVKIVRTANNSL